jgi:predicted AAA+ superfamily ATPase
MYKRTQFKILKNRLDEPRRFIQVVTGPRQIGKTTLVHQILDEIEIPYHFSSADDTFSDNVTWIEQQWEVARLKLKQAEADSFLLVIDEIQKIKQWSRGVKNQWDKDSRNRVNIKVILLGSSRLLLEAGLTESLTGRFERIFMSHWSFTEMQNAFGLTLDEFIWFGGYPGAISLKAEEQRWKDYIRNAIIETTISKDILQLARIYKPALLRRLFEFSCNYSSKIFSYTKMLGQLVDAGNTTTLASYLLLLDSANLVTGLENYSGSLVRTKSSSPKLHVQNTAFIAALKKESLAEILLKRDDWGQHVESAIGAHLLNNIAGTGIKLYYWRQRNDEVDFVLEYGSKIIGIEVKSAASNFHKGTAIFKGKYHPYKVLLVGEGGIELKDFLQLNPKDLF